MKFLALLAILGLVSGAPTEDSELAESTTTSVPPSVDLGEAKAYLEKINAELGEWHNKVEIANWAYDSNLTDANLAEKLRVSGEAAKYVKQLWEEVQSYPWQNIEDYEIKRQFTKLSTLGPEALPEEEYQEFQETISKMQNIYATAKICDYKDQKKCDLALEPELTEKLETSRDAEELKYIWTEWRKAVGEKVKPLYPKYVDLSNKAARMNQYEDNANYWLKDYEADDIMEQIETLWEQVKPFYTQLHAHVRRGLREKYGENIVSKDGPIPAHLLGNMWAQSWSNIADLSMPYPGKQLPDVTESMVNQGYNATKIFQLAESCFVSMNMSAMPDTFWKNSILEKPTDRELVCHASAWDFYDAQDFRIKQCTRVTVDHLTTAHHEMGHIQYFLQYKEQPVVFREGANPGFHEAVGDVMSLSVSTLNHLKKIGLLDTDVTDAEADLNNLYLMGLDKIAFLPFAYVMDRWRWDAFQGKMTSDQYNCNWWKLSGEVQGIEPPVDRTEEDFDPASKYHIVANVEYLRYFISFIVQFQFHKALCIEAGEYDPMNPQSKLLHMCDITESAKAGNLLKSMLQMGSSRPWQDAMEKLTGQRKMDASGLMDYFKPLYEWLVKENEKNGEYIGWQESNRNCVQTRGELSS